jgi:hypothetical protein
MGNTIKRFASVTVLALGMVSLFAVAAFAQAGPDLSAVNSGISTSVDSLKGLVVTNIPVIMGLVALTVGLPFGIKLLRRFAK